MPAGRVRGFLPSTCGFAFANRFPPQPLWRLRLPGLGGVPLGDAANGLCGGMVFAAWDLFALGQPPPPEPDPPGYGSPLFRYLVKRLCDSFHLPWGPLTYYRWMRAPDAAVGDGLARRTVRREWPGVRRALDAGRPAALGLIRLRSANPLRLGQNHQVLAYAYDLDEARGDLTLWVYDPNHPRRDDLTLSLNLHRLGGPGRIAAPTGETYRGFFRTPYSPRRPPALRPPQPLDTHGHPED
jgi:hypothetical protein